MANQSINQSIGHRLIKLNHRLTEDQNNFYADILPLLPCCWNVAASLEQQMASRFIMCRSASMFTIHRKICFLSPGEISPHSKACMVTTCVHNKKHMPPPRPIQPSIKLQAAYEPSKRRSLQPPCKANRHITWPFESRIQ